MVKVVITIIVWFYYPHQKPIYSHLYLNGSMFLYSLFIGLNHCVLLSYNHMVVYNQINNLMIHICNHLLIYI